MRKISFVVLLLAITAVSCLKTGGRDCSEVTIKAPASEVEALRTYLDTNGITATEDSRGFFYSIQAAGDTKPTVCDYITISYVGKLLNGTQFDASDNASFYLSQLITGWQEALPLIGTGGSMVLYLPPSLGYGGTAVGDIPANSNLMFNIGLKAVN